MWYFQISNDFGSILYSQGEGIIPISSTPMLLAQSMLHSMNVAIKHSFYDESMGIAENVITAQKIYINNDISIYMNGGYMLENIDISQYNKKSLQEAILKGIYNSIYYGLVMMLGYKRMHSGKEEENTLRKDLKVLIIYIMGVCF